MQEGMRRQIHRPAPIDAPHSLRNRSSRQPSQHTTTMKKGRLEAFSDGVIAIIITIMVLNLKAPDGHQLSALYAILPTFCGYLLSFMYVGIYWNNHHHLLQAVGRISGATLWANLHLLFWLSLVPFVTEWMGHDYAAAIPVALYGFILLMCGFAFDVLTRVLERVNDAQSTLADISKVSAKSIFSVMIYAFAIAFAFFIPAVSLALYVGVALLWIVPERRIENTLVQ
jgi:uncharacterized membrane protein